MDRGAWRAAVYGVIKSQAEQLSTIAQKLTEGLPWWLSGKESACDAGDLGSIPGLGRFPWRRKWQPIPVFLPGEKKKKANWTLRGRNFNWTLSTMLSSKMTLSLLNMLQSAFLNSQPHYCISHCIFNDATDSSVKSPLSYQKTQLGSEQNLL